VSPPASTPAALDASQLRAVAQYLEDAEELLPLVEPEDAAGLCASMYSLEAWLDAEIATWASPVH
jgi:hypothetical protein